MQADADRSALVELLPLSVDPRRQAKMRNSTVEASREVPSLTPRESRIGNVAHEWDVTDSAETHTDGEYIVEPILDEPIPRGGSIEDQIVDTIAVDVSQERKILRSARSGEEHGGAVDASSVPGAPPAGGR